MRCLTGTTMLTRVPVHLGERSYEILIGTPLMKDVATHLQAMKFGRRGAIITDETVSPLYAQTLQATLRAGGYDAVLCSIPAGEKSKNLDQVASLYEELLDAGLDRKSFVVALGGGVVGDLA